MPKPNTTERDSLLKDIDFCVFTQGNRENLERLLNSIAKHYAGAKVYIADATLDLDRSYYKKLRIELEQAGLINRMVVFQLANKAGEAAARNYLMSNTPSKYKAFFEDTDVITEKTRIEEMALILESHKTIGVTCGTFEEGATKHTPTADGDEYTTDGLTVYKTKEANRFMVVVRDLQNYIRFEANTKDYIATFSDRMAKVPYQMVALRGSLLTSIKDKTNEAAQPGVQTQKSPESTGDNNGNPPEPTIPNSGQGNGGDQKGTPSGQNEDGKDTTRGGGHGGGDTRPVQRAGK